MTRCRDRRRRVPPAYWQRKTPARSHDHGSAEPVPDALHLMTQPHPRRDKVPFPQMCERYRSASAVLRSAQNPSVSPCVAVRFDRDDLCRRPKKRVLLIEDHGLASPRAINRCIVVQAMISVKAQSAPTSSLSDLMRELANPSTRCISMDVFQAERSERDMRKQ